MGPEITVVIADDHPIFRRGLREIIEEEAGLVVVGKAEDGGRAVAAGRSYVTPVLTDYLLARAGS
jgi:YesN/AraC family two-component response regulator